MSLPVPSIGVRTLFPLRKFYLLHFYHLINIFVAYRYKLKCHIRDLHSIQYESCSLCKKRFTKRHCLVVHVRKIHNGLSEAERKKLLLEPDEDQIKQQASKAKKEKSNKVVQRCMIERCDVIFENA